LFSQKTLCRESRFTAGEGMVAFGKAAKFQACLAYAAQIHAIGDLL
jgi:hypothetical protein